MRKNNLYDAPMAEIVCLEVTDILTTSSLENENRTSLQGISSGAGSAKNEFDY